MDKNSKIYIAGHRGLIGNAILGELNIRGYKNLIYKTHADLDLMRQDDVEQFFNEYKPEYIVFSAVKKNNADTKRLKPASELVSNLQMTLNVIEAARKKCNIKSFLMISSGAIYPEEAPIPLKESNGYFNGTYPQTDESYCLAKIVASKLCDYHYREYGINAFSVCPCVVYGENDNFDPKNAPIIPGVMRRIHEAKIRGDKEFILWGSGNPLRTYLYVRDAACACVELLLRFQGTGHFNIGDSKQVSIMTITQTIKEVVGFEGNIICDKTKPDGIDTAPLDCTKIFETVGWKSKVSLEDGLRMTYAWFLKQKHI
jgi:GDP-L-fucose synthase